jgi:hypothetical protein
MQRESFSIATTRRAPSNNNPRVRPPGPGPISSTSQADKSPADRAILAVRVKSSKKFCPNFFLLPSHALQLRRAVGAAHQNLTLFKPLAIARVWAISAAMRNAATMLCGSAKS